MSLAIDLVAQLKHGEGPLDRRAELAEQETTMTVANDLAVRRVLEAAGVEFIDENGGGPGVRLPKSSKQKSRK